MSEQAQCTICGVLLSEHHGPCGGTPSYPPSRQMTAAPLTPRQYAQAIAMSEDVRIRLNVREALKSMMIHVLPLGTDEESTQQWIDRHYPSPRVEVLEEWLTQEAPND